MMMSNDGYIRVTFYVIGGALLGMLWSLGSMVYVAVRYVTVSYPLNWMIFPFNLPPTRETILLVSMLSSTASNIVFYAAMAFMVGVGVRCVFGRNRRSLFQQLFCSLAVILVWIEGRYLVNIAGYTFLPGRYQFFNELKREVLTLALFCALAVVIKMAIQRLAGKEKAKRAILSAIATGAYCLLMVHYTGFRLVQVPAFNSVKTMSAFAGNLFGAIVTALIVYNCSPRILSAPALSTDWTMKVKSAAVRSFKYSVAAYTVLFLLISSIVFVSPHFMEESTHSNADGVNIILISIDALRPDHLSCYGYALPTSPHIDGLAGESSLFTNAISVSPYTLGSVPCIMTSLYPGQIGMGENDLLELSRNNVTLAELLQRGGYETAAFIGNYFLRKKFGVWQGFHVYDDNFSSLERERRIPEETAGNLTHKAVSWLKTYHEKKFFLWLHYQDTHGPYTPPPPFDTAFRRDQYPHRDPVRLLADNSGYGGIPRYQIVNGERDPNFYLSQYDGELHYVDYNIGILIDTLKKMGIYGKTVVILTADHGEAMVNEGGYYFCHGESLRDEIIRIPLIMKIPGLPQGKLVSTQVASLDIAPTILDLAGIEKTGSMMGESLLDLLKGGRYSRKYVYSHKVSMSSVSRSVRTNEYKLVKSRNTVAFYDLATDPVERVNLVTREDMRQTVTRFKELLDSHVQRIMKISPLYGKTTVDEKTKTMLKALGYID